MLKLLFTTLAQAQIGGFGNTQRSGLTIAALVLLPTLAQAQTVDFGNSFNSPRIYSPQGEYLGNLNRNQFDPNSVSNPYGAGNPYRGNGVNNQFSPNYVPGLGPHSPGPNQRGR